ncbi:MAG: GMC family oxidoreductase [Saprospiraceae bacterium]
MFFNSQGADENTYDAIVVGTGISGGWAAKELTEKGLKTLVLERGRMVKHGDYPTASLDPWDMDYRGQVPAAEIEQHYQKQSRTGYTIREESKHWFVKDDEHPYTEVKRFDWMRGYHMGGRSLMWGRHSYRLSDLDLAANAKDGVAIDWPVRYAEIAPWYDKVETFAGISGRNEGLSQLPDGQFLPAMELNCAEDHLSKKVKEKLGWTVTPGRVAHLTSYDPAIHLGTRGACQYRNRCVRGCPFGGYFSSLSSTLPVASATGNMTVRPHSVVYSLIYDANKKRATGVRVRDAETGEEHEFHAKVIFLCASALASTYILMNTKTEATPDGLGASSGALGKYVMDHHFRAGASGWHDNWQDKYYKGRKPNGFYVPRIQNLGTADSKREYLRGFGYQGGSGRADWTRGIKELNTTLGADFKDKLLRPGDWSCGMTAFAEMLPDERNTITLNEEVRDINDLPTLTMDAANRENEMAMRQEMQDNAAEMLDAAGFKDVSTYDAGSWPGLGIHEMGTARMGKSPTSSVLNKHNQVWDAPNVYVTDGSFMTSAACVNPSLTYMAFTARAADHAVSELKKMNL